MNDRYQVLEEPEYGGFGNATLCLDTHLDRKVIIKKINDTSDLSRLLNEIEAFQKVRSKHAVQIYDVIPMGNNDFALVEEFLPGLDLFDYQIDREDTEQLFKILYQLSCGIADIHNCGIVHRDFTPANVKFDVEDILKLFDFGLAKHKHLPDSTNGIIGTPGYMAPELYNAPPLIDKPVDCYSFGCICFYLITGKPPKCARKRPIPGPQNVYESISQKIDIPDNISTLIDSCLKVDPSQRPTMELIKNTLKNQLLYGQHKATIISGNMYSLDEPEKGVRIYRLKEDSVTIVYDGYRFYVKNVTGNVYVNKLQINEGETLEGSSVIILGHPNKGAARKFATFDISHPEVVFMKKDNNIYSTNEVIGSRYSIIRYLDAGGMQEVYVAFDNLLNRDVALKTPKTQHAEKRFKRSAVLSAKVNHPNVAKLYDYLEQDGRAILIEELISGKSLHFSLDNDFYYFDPYLLAQFGHHISKGIAASHHVGVVHRDLKPGNIILESINGIYQFKITDFGIATLTESEFEEAAKDETSITGSQTMMGAIPYMSPEMIQGIKYADKPTDIWSLGAILYRLMSGNYPFGVGLSAIPVIDRAELPLKPSTFHTLSQFSWLNDELWAIITRCLEKDQELRPTADQLTKIFENICYGVFPRKEGRIKDFRSGTGNWGFINFGFNDVFFHRDSFYGIEDQIQIFQRVQFASHRGVPSNRAHPIIPLKSMV